MKNINKETYGSYAAMLKQYADYRETDTPDEYMGEVLDAFANVGEMAPVFHCSGHGKGRISIMLATTDVKTLMRIYDDIIYSNSEYINAINTELSVTIKRRAQCGDTAFAIWKSYVLRVSVKDLRKGEDAHNDNQLKLACSDLTDIVSIHRARVSSGSVINPLLPDHESWYVNYVVLKEALFAWDQITNDGKSIDHYLLSPILAKRQKVTAFLMHYGEVTRTATRTSISEDVIDYHTELRTLSHLLENK